MSRPQKETGKMDNSVRFRLTDDEITELDNIVLFTGMSRSEILRKALKWYVRNMDVIAKQEALEKLADARPKHQTRRNQTWETRANAVCK